MATLVGQPGEGAGLRGFVDLLALPAVFASAFAIGTVVGAVVAVFNPQTGLLLMVACILGAALSLVGREGRRSIADLVGSRHWLKGEAGERKVAAVLATLPDDYVVFNDFHPASEDAVRSAWVDHIVIGPRGVFVIETKNSLRSRIGSASSDVWNRRAVRQAQRNAKDLKGHLATWSGGTLHLFVVPLVVYAHEDARVVQLREGAVSVVPVEDLNRQILELRGSPIGADERSGVVGVLFSKLDESAQIRFEPSMAPYREPVGDERLAVQSASVVTMSSMFDPGPSWPSAGAEAGGDPGRHFAVRSPAHSASSSPRTSSSVRSWKSS